MTAKGMEMPAYDPRGLQGQGLLYATSNRGGCHMRGNMIGLEILGLPKLINRFQVQGKSSFVILNQNSNAAIDSLVVCKFTNMGVADEYFARVLSAVTGVHYATGDMIKVGERVWNLERLYNNREGFTTKEDTLKPQPMDRRRAGYRSWSRCLKNTIAPAAGMSTGYPNHRSYKSLACPV